MRRREISNGLKSMVEACASVRVEEFFIITEYVTLIGIQNNEIESQIIHLFDYQRSCEF